MPHVIVKMYAGKTEEQKQALTAEIQKALMTAIGSTEKSISVAIEDIDPAEWTDKVYLPEIAGKPDLIYKKPGYDPFA